MPLTQNLWKHPIISIAGDVNADMVRGFDTRLNDAVFSDTEKPVTILLGSGGGQLFYGISMYERLRYLSNVRPVDLVVLGYAASAATLLMLGVPRSRRYIGRHSRINLHQFRFETNIPRQVVSGAEIVLQETIRDLRDARGLYDFYLRLLAKEMRRLVSEVRELVDQSVYLGPRQAVKMGLMGAIVAEGREVGRIQRST